MRKLYRIFAACLSCGILVLMSLVLYLNIALPNDFYLTEWRSLALGTPLRIRGEAAPAASSSASSIISDSYTTQLKMLGGVAIKEVDVQVVQRKLVVPCGYPFGIKMFTEGVVVVGLTDVEKDGRFLNPAQQAGIRVGDVLLEMGGQPIQLNEQVAQIVGESGGKPLTYTLRRKGELVNGVVQPILADNGDYKAGIWVRDSSAGIGTMTFYDPETLVFAGLGHAVCDVDTGEVMPLGKGEIVDVYITGAHRGVTGSPGELQGSFSSSALRGFLMENNETGVYGRLKAKPMGGVPIPMALKQEVMTGPAQIYTTISGSKPQAYDIVIEKINLGDQAATKNMVIKVTDPKLLEAAGGIVQGMSGSPIIQNGQLVGAVTHVFVNDLTRGYGIFAENMNATVELVEQAYAG